MDEISRKEVNIWLGKNSLLSKKVEGSIDVVNKLVKSAVLVLNWIDLPTAGIFSFTCRKFLPMKNKLMKIFFHSQKVLSYKINWWKLLSTGMRQWHVHYFNIIIRFEQVNLKWVSLFLIHFLPHFVSIFWPEKNFKYYATPTSLWSLVCSMLGLDYFFNFFDFESWSEVVYSLPLMRNEAVLFQRGANFW